ncbi:MAG: ROK family protein [candidate division WOR-3 bacterium]
MSFSIGVDVGGTNIKIGLVDGKGSVVARRRLRTNLNELPEVTLDRISRVVQGLKPRQEINSLGIGVAGLVDHRNGVLVFSPNLPLWQRVRVKEVLCRLTGLDVFCANDANAFVLGEWLYGAARGYKNVLCVTLGTGVGTGIIVHNRLLLGGNDFAGELGHSTISFGGPNCLCGNRGCLERYVGAQAIVNRARRLLRKEQKRLSVTKNQLCLFGITSKSVSRIFELVGYDLNWLTPKEIGRAARKGDKLAMKVVMETGEFLGKGIYNAIMILDPEVVVLGGGISGWGRMLLKAVKESVFRRLYGSDRRLKFVLSELGGDAGILGASQLSRWLGQFF